MDTKICPSCKNGKPLTSEFFYFRKDGRPCSYCKVCFSEQSKQKKLEQKLARLSAVDIAAVEHAKLFKTCGRCHKELPRTEEFWHFRPGRKPGSPRIPYSYCKSCNGEYATQWKRDNREQYRAWNRQDKRNLRAEVIAAYGGECTCCGESHPEFLDMDHIKGGGRAHIKLLQSQGNFYVWIKKQNFPKDLLRLLCANCNQSRGRYGYCPHEKEREAVA